MSDRTRPRFFDGPKLFTFVVVLCAIAALAIARAACHHNDSKKDIPQHAESTAPSTHTGNIAPYQAEISTEKLDGATADPSALQPLGKTISDYIDDNAAGSSVYIEDLSRRVAVRVGETKAYNTKSLMKVPLVMSLYKAAELGRLNLDQDITLTPGEIDKTYGDLWKKGAGYRLTLRDAIKLALQQSDNTAIRAINDHTFKVMRNSERAYMALSLEMKVQSNGDSYMTTKAYSSVFRCLYDACYNRKQDSDEMIKLMSTGDFKAPNQLLPDNVAVAHKIGNVDQNGFNDCGIVYGAKSPFLFCIMLSQGEPQADEDIAHIIRQGYDFLQNQD